MGFFYLFRAGMLYDMELATPVSTLKTVGIALLRRLERLGITTVRDLLFYFPFRHEDWRAVSPIASLKDGQETTVRGRIELIASRRTPRTRRVLTEALVRDDSGSVRVVWFNQPHLGKQLNQGDELSLSGKVKEDVFGVQMVSPMWERASREATNTGRIIPLYPTTEGVTQKQLRFLMKQALSAVKYIREWLPHEIRDRADVCGVREAITQFHFPDSPDALHHAEARLKFDELLLVQMLGMANRAAMGAMRAPHVPFHADEVRAFVARLPYTLTAHQKKAAWEILQDMEREQPMNRLLEGDVGSGKTVVAAIAAYNAALSGFQTVIMAPTEVLAAQHLRTLGKLFGETMTIGIMTRTQKNNPDAQILVGTHALLEEDVTLQKLGLVIVDEQHRFGVQQRRLLKEKSATGATPHFLSMSATPIPRSFALTVFGDLDLSIIPELPPGRRPIITRLVESRNREKAYAFTRKQIEAGRQAFVICPLIEPSAREEKKAVMDVYKRLSEDIYKDLRVAYLHGRMKGKEKDAVMQKFAAGDTDILVSTSVIEVGVDVPNATVMWLEGAERFGLAQLHQFRGRVGRAEHQSYCLVFSETDSEKSLERLRLFEKERNGFVLAEKDLEMRGPGEVFGTAQSGMMHLKLARLTDRVLIQKSRDVARWLFEKDATLARWPTVAAYFETWQREVHLE